MKRAVRCVFYAAFLYVFGIFMNTYVIQRVDVVGDSMAPELTDGDIVIVDKLTYHFQPPKRFEKVVFEYRYRDGSYYIKRVIGLPGETIQILNGAVWINGEPLEESYGTEIIWYAKRAEEPVTLGENEYFLLGDNRNNSSDSRDSDIGDIAFRQIAGKVLFHYRDKRKE